MTPTSQMLHLSKWINSNKLSVIAAKTELMLFSSGQTLNNVPETLEMPHLIFWKINFGLQMHGEIIQFYIIKQIKKRRLCSVLL